MIRPLYFDSFSCLAGDCPDSCCKAGWEITVDESAFDIYSALEGDIGCRFRNSLCEGADGDRIFKLDEHNVCPFYNCDGLCDLYIATGGKMTEICTHYPRFYEEFDGFTEAGISVSCPEAIRLVLAAGQSAYDLPDEHSEDEMLEVLINERRLAFELIEKLEADEAAMVLLDRAARLQAKFDLNDIADLGESPKLNLVHTKKNEELLSALCEGILDCTDILCDSWKISLEAGKNGEFDIKQIDEKTKKNYLKYLTYRYYLKAINAEDVLSQMLLICALYILPQALAGDFKELCRCAAKEIEHNAENREALLEGFFYGELLSVGETAEAIGFVVQD